jgi:hypothetical protein
MEFLPQPIPNLEDERAFELLFSQLQNIARATRDRTNFAEPKEGPTHEEIELRAYQIFQEQRGVAWTRRGGLVGSRATINRRALPARFTNFCENWFDFYLNPAARAQRLRTLGTSRDSMMVVVGYGASLPHRQQRMIDTPTRSANESETGVCSPQNRHTTALRCLASDASGTYLPPPDCRKSPELE